MDAPPPPSTGDPPLPQRFRIMCSYGGHIIPRPHDKTLSYIGGDTRIVVVDRHLPLAELHARLAVSLDHSEPFLLKYQLPGEDLDSLISVATDEDLQNMIEEHDRLRNKQGRLRLFLFPKTAQSFDLGLVCGNKGSSDEWFMGVLNGKVKSLSAAFSDSLNCLIGLEFDGGDDKSGDYYASKEGAPSVENEKKTVGDCAIAKRDAHSVPESPIIQTNSSSFGSASSPKSAKIGVLGADEQFQQLGVLGGSHHSNVVDQKQQNSKDAAIELVGGGDFVNTVNRVFASDDERSDHGGGHRKVQETRQQVQSQQLQQRQANVGGLFELASPDSVSSEGSITNPMSRQRQALHHQEPTFVQIQSAISKTDSNVMDQIQESGYVLSGQYNQPKLHHPQQFVHHNTQYVTGGPVPVSSYYPIYPSQHHQQNHPNQPTQPYPVYFIQARPPQAYDLPPQKYSELPPNMTYSQALNAPLSNQETASGGYRTSASSAAPQLVQVPLSQQQANYVSYAQIHHPSQSMAAQSLAGNKGAYAYEVADHPPHSQVYYAAAAAQPPAPPRAVAQYPTMISSAPQDASSQNLAENAKQP